MSETTIVSGQPNLAQLIKDGRVTIDPATREVENPLNPTADTFTTRVIRGGRPEDITVSRNLGHATIDGIWRSGLAAKVVEFGRDVLTADSPPELYHKMTELLAKRKKLGKTEDFRPELTEEETRSYLEWKVAQKIKLTDDEQKALEALSA